MKLPSSLKTASTAGQWHNHDMDVQTTNCFDALDTHFRTSNPIFKIHSKLLKQNGNELFSVYITRLKEHSEKSDLHNNITHKDIILLIPTMTAIRRNYTGHKTICQPNILQLSWLLVMASFLADCCSSRRLDFEIAVDPTSLVAPKDFHDVLGC